MTPEIHRKTIAPTGLKLDASRVRAVFSVFDRLDSDGDVVIAGAIPDGAEIILSSWNHGSWHPGVLPLGRGVIRTGAAEATIDATIFGTAAGQETLAVLDGLGNLCKWSFGFQILDHDFTTINGKRARLLTRLDVHEASPVLLAANDWTRTIAVGDMTADDAVAREYAQFAQRELDRQIAEEMTRIRENAA